MHPRCNHRAGRLEQFRDICHQTGRFRSPNCSRMRAKSPPSSKRHAFGQGRNGDYDRGMSTWDRLRELRLAVDSSATETLSFDVGWVRKTTVVALRGAGEEGLGEDVTYDAAEHERFPELYLAGEWTLE